MTEGIKPTVGRIVYYTPASDDPNYAHAPLAAIIAQVFTSTCVNLAIFDAHGRPYEQPPTSIRLVQPFEEAPEDGPFCEWMPYQVKKPTGSESGEVAAGTETIGEAAAVAP